jgi:hypothetical protein
VRFAAGALPGKTPAKPVHVEAPAFEMGKKVNPEQRRQALKINALFVRAKAEHRIIEPLLLLYKHPKSTNTSALATKSSNANPSFSSRTYTLFSHIQELQRNRN